VKRCRSIWVCCIHQICWAAGREAEYERLKAQINRAKVLEELQQIKMNSSKRPTSFLPKRPKKKLKNQVPSESKLAAQSSENPKLTLKNT
jgi:hypothetical protein